MVVLAGGKGERLWPLSRQKCPKQVLSFDHGMSLLERTIKRVVPLVQKEKIWIITTEQHKELINQHVGSHVDTILAEPCSRNTAPAILLTCFEIMERDQDAFVVFLPADHVIEKEDIFRKNITEALEVCYKYNYITLLGANPQWPATGYGYIEYEKNESHGADVAPKVVRFHEKPSLATATAYMKCSNMLWNIGIVCGKVSDIIQEYKKTAPVMVENVSNYFKRLGTYDCCEHSSIDRSVLEKSDAIHVIPVEFGWSDVGNLDIFLSLRSKHHHVSHHIVEIDAHNNLVEVPKKLVALIDVDNLCIVETDDVLLITKRNQTDKVKNILDHLKRNNEERYL